MTPRKTNIGGLLSEYERRKLKLPEFQRSYSWEKTQVATFWGDLTSFRKTYEKKPIDASYFLGAIVAIESSTEITILDGQQRLATATILLAALRDTATKLHEANPSQELAYLARDIQRELIEKKDVSPRDYSLSLGELDEPYFLQSIKTDPPSNAKPRLRSHQLMKKAYDYFSGELSLLVEHKSPSDQAKELISLRDVLIKGMSLIVIVVDDEQDAYDIFEALNDRGLRLSVPDLVINLLLKRCSTKTDRDAVRKTWNAMIQLMGRRDVARYLRHLWLSQYGDLKAMGLYSAIKDHLSQNTITSVAFAQSSLEACEEYLKILDVDKSLPKDSIRNIEGLVRYLSVQNSLPLLLSGRLCLNDSDFSKLAKLATALYVRHSLIGNRNPLELETVFYDAAREMRAQKTSKQSSAKVLRAAKAKFVKLNPSDAVVEDQFKDLVLSRSEASWFLAQLANQQQSKTKEIGMDRANVEHIFPQNAGMEWTNRAALEPFIWHVGNLTILGERINSKAQNKSFTDKCNEHYSKSEIIMSKDLLKYDKWNEDVIRIRAVALSKLAAQTWK